ncbi:MAG: hypothetical protein UZ19_OD1000456 [Parcubacteria bacterium OLB19]|nr:MAG: hypothetical protein UZ19_OD1000456 [Parcubacteria bacterium OLB19]
MSITIIEIVILLLVVAFVIYLVTPRSKFGNYTGLKEQISRDEYLDIMDLLKEAQKVGFNLDCSDVSQINNFYQGLNSRDFELEVSRGVISFFEDRFNSPPESFWGCFFTPIKYRAIKLFCDSIQENNQEKKLMLSNNLF